MEVVSHQAVRVHLPAEPLDDLAEQNEEVITIALGAIEDRPLLDSSGANVIEDVRSLEAEIAWHRFRR
jgi:hypothetical protein